MIPDNYFQYWNVGIVGRNKKRQNSTIDTHVGREGQKDLADSYEEQVVKGLVIAARIVCIRGSSHENKATPKCSSGYNPQEKYCSTNHEVGKTLESGLWQLKVSVYTNR